MKLKMASKSIMSCLIIFLATFFICITNTLAADTNSAVTLPDNSQSTPVTSSQPAALLDLTISASSGKNTSYLKDASYDTYAPYSADETLTLTSDQPMYGIYIIWRAKTDPWTLSYNGQTKQCGTNGFLHEYVEIPEGTTSCTIQLSKTESICDIYAYSQGTLPDDVEVWQPSCDTADFLVFSTHADDEILFLGGVLATYGGQQNDRVQVVYMTNYWNGTKIREHEKLDGLWASGIRYYPVNGPFDDLYATTLDAAKKLYNIDEVTAFVTEQIRRFKPLVCVTQDINGEYGHGGHMLLAASVQTAVTSSMDESFCPESVQTYGVWDVPKTYLHLYPENTITMNLRTPLSRFNNQTALETAAAAYKKHVSQQWCWFYVSDEYRYSCADFGLFRSTVGTDTGNDMLENVTTYEVQEEEARKKAEEESKAASIAASEAESSSIAAEQKAISDANKEKNVKSAIKIIVIVVVVIALIALTLFIVRYINIRNRRKRRRH